VEAVAKDLSQCHRTQQPAVAARLKEARQQLQQHKDCAASCKSRFALLQRETQQAAAAAEQAQGAVHAARSQLVNEFGRTSRAHLKRALLDALDERGCPAVAMCGP
jgi:cell division septum initiation protein DivIVA